MFKKVLIANRGEIAMRILRACKELGVETVAVHSVADADALHVRFASEAVCIGPAPARESYLNIPSIISAAEVTAADAIHPGYGFLAENAGFAETVGKCGLTFIGPSPESLRLWGDKVRARAQAEKHGIPLLPASQELSSAEHACSEAEKVGYPVILKAKAGGGGRGMRIVRSSGEMAAAFAAAAAEAEAAFGDGGTYVERYLEAPRHIEFQALADEHGGVWTFGERECSLQRRHQKLLEEAPSPNLSDDQRAKMAELIRQLLKDSGYTSLGTLEFLMDSSGQLFFMEMNPRVQVEHPVTEAVVGLDLVVLQIRAAAGEPLELPDTRPWKFRGHAVECRILAEDAHTFRASPGLITQYHPPGGAGVRVDSGVYGGFRVPPNYDSLLAKVIASGRTRDEALRRMAHALQEFIIAGIDTNVLLHERLIADPEVRSGKATTLTVERVAEALRAERESGTGG